MSEGFGNDFHSYGTASNLCSKAGRKQNALVCSMCVCMYVLCIKESFKLFLAIKVEKIWRYKSRNSLATKNFKF